MMKSLLYLVFSFYLCLSFEPNDTESQIQVTNSSMPRNLETQSIITAQWDPIQTNAEQIINISWTPIRINFTYINPSEINKSDQAILDTLFNIATTFFMKHIQVRSRAANNPIKWIEGFVNWYGLSIPANIQNMTWDCDFVFLVYIYNNPSQVIAFSRHISLDTTTLRPIMGIIHINLAYINKPLTDLSSESHVSLYLHHLVHALAFDPLFYNKFYDSVTGKPYTKENAYEILGIVYLRTPRLLNLARQYFNCSNMTGIQLEDEGGDGISGKHFERSLFWKELMTDPSTIANSLVTDFTFQLLQDTGYFRVSEYNPDTLNGWGENRGCGFVQSYCKGGQFPEFCNGVSNCTFELSAQGMCIVDKLSNQCTYQQFQSSSGIDCKDNSLNILTQAAKNYQHFGYDSICIDTLINTSLQVNSTVNCYQYTCSPENNTLSLMINNLTIDCSEAASAQKLEGMSQSIICPQNPKSICTQSNDCLNNCNQKGFCTGGVCTCIIGYSGSGCEQTCNQLRRKDQCVSTCPTGTYLISSISYCIGCPASCATCSNYNLCLTCNQGYDLRGGFCDLNGKPTTVQQTIPNQNQTQTNNTKLNSTQLQNSTSTTANNNTSSTNTSGNNTLTNLSNSTNNATSNSTSTTTNSSTYEKRNTFLNLVLLSLYFI